MKSLKIRLIAIIALPGSLPREVQVHLMTGEAKLPGRTGKQTDILTVSS